MEFFLKKKIINPTTVKIKASGFVRDASILKWVTN